MLQGGLLPSPESARVLPPTYNLRIIALAIMVLSCPYASLSQQNAKPSPLKTRIAEADPKNYPHVRDAADWKNPYLIVRRDGIEVRKTGADKTGTLMLAETVGDFLEKLPNANWPYGRVVAVAENGIMVTGDQPPMAANSAALLAQLRKIDVKVDFWGSE